MAAKRAKNKTVRVVCMLYRADTRLVNDTLWIILDIRQPAETLQMFWNSLFSNLKPDRYKLNKNKLKKTKTGLLTLIKTSQLNYD